MKRNFQICITLNHLTIRFLRKAFISQMDIFIGARMHATIGHFPLGLPQFQLHIVEELRVCTKVLGYKYVVDLAELNTHEAVELTVEYVKKIQGVEIRC